jgi:hypothetical protein
MVNFRILPKEGKMLSSGKSGGSETMKTSSIL